MSSFHLKGSGWYVTDYGGNRAPASETKKDDAAKSETTDTVKADSTAKTSTED
jgi:predicted nucleic acid-binding Zn ribbon protein